MTHPASLDNKKPVQNEWVDEGKGAKKSKKLDKSDPSLKCSVCKSQYESRNKLMQHLKDTGHAMAPAYR